MSHVKTIPCPLCGNKNLVFTYEFSHGHGDCGYQNGRIQCSICSLSLGNAYGYGIPGMEAENETRRQWNEAAAKLIKPDNNTYPDVFQVCDGDLREVCIPVKVMFEYSDKIVADYDSETGMILEYTTGYIMKVMPNQSAVYNGQAGLLIARCLREDNQ